MAPLRHFLEALINPFFIIFLLFFVSFILLLRNKCTQGSKRGLLLFLVMFLLLSTGWLPSYLTHSLEDQYPIVQKTNPDIKWVVVLSGGQANKINLSDNHLLYSASLKRLIEGIRLYHQLPAAKLLLSGGGYKKETPEAVRLFNLALKLGVPADKMALESSSINTSDQALALKPLLGKKPFYLVTSSLHMPRAMALCQRQGLNPIPAPTDFTHYWSDERWEKMYLPNPNNMVYVNIAWHEILGRIWERIMGQL